MKLLTTAIKLAAEAHDGQVDKAGDLIFSIPCSGRRIGLHADDMHLAMGRVRYRDTKETFVWPQNLKCMYCKASPYSIINKTVEKAKQLMIDNVEDALTVR